jgi:WD40 repeat protein
MALILFFLPSGVLSAPPAKDEKDWQTDSLPKGATARLGRRTFYGDSLYALNFSPSGQELLIPYNGFVHRWDVLTGKELVPKPYPASAPNPQASNVIVAGDRLLTLEFPSNNPGQRDRKGILTVTDLKGGGRVCQLLVSGPLLYFEGSIFPPSLPTLAVTRDGRYLAMASDAEKAIDFYALDTGARLNHWTIGSGRRTSLYLTHDGKILYFVGAGQPIRRADPVGGMMLPDLAGTTGSTNFIDVSPDGKWAVTRESYVEKNAAGNTVAVLNRPYLTVHDVPANKVLGRLEIGSAPLHYRFIESDAVVVLTADPAQTLQTLPFRGRITRWNVVTRQKEWETSVAGTHRVLTSADGRWVVVTESMGLFDVLDAKTGKPQVTRTGHDSSVAWIGFSPDGTRIITANNRTILTWHLKQSERLSEASPPELRTGQMLPPILGEKLVWVELAADRKSAHLVGWDLARSAVAWRMPMGDQIPGRTYSHDGNRVVAVHWDVANRVWAATVYDGPAGRMVGHWTISDRLWADGVNRYNAALSPPMALSGDGKALFAGGDGVIKFEVTSGNKTVHFPTEKIAPVDGRFTSPIAVSRNGTRVADLRTPNRGTTRYTLRVYDTLADKVVREFNFDSMYDPSVKISPDGKRVAVCEVREKVIHLFEVDSDNAPRKLVGTARVTSLAFSPDGMTLVSGHMDGTALVWDLSVK